VKHRDPFVTVWHALRACLFVPPFGNAAAERLPHSYSPLVGGAALVAARVLVILSPEGAKNLVALHVW